MRHIAKAFLVGLLGLAAFSPQAQEPLRLAPAVAQLVVIDAFVTDNKGRPVSNLAATDFELLDDHKKVQIVGFEAPRASAADGADSAKALPLPGTARATSGPDAEVMVIFIDRKLLSPGGRRRALDQSSALATEHLRLGGRVVVAAEDGPLRPLTPVTADPLQVRAGLERIGELAIQSPGTDHERIVLSQFELIIEAEGCLRGLPQLINVVRDYARFRAIAGLPDEWLARQNDPPVDAERFRLFIEGLAVDEANPQ